MNDMHVPDHIIKYLGINYCFWSRHRQTYAKYRSDTTIPICFPDRNQIILSYSRSKFRASPLSYSLVNIEKDKYSSLAVEVRRYATEYKKILEELKNNDFKRTTFSELTNILVCGELYRNLVERIPNSWLNSRDRVSFSTGISYAGNKAKIFPIRDLDKETVPLELYFRLENLFRFIDEVPVLKELIPYLPFYIAIESINDL